MIYLDAPQAKDKILAELEKQRSIDIASGLPPNVDEEKRNQPRESQIHYAYCLGAATDGWTAQQKSRFAGWFEHAMKWQGGHSFRGYLEYILRDWQKNLTTDEDASLLAWYKPSKPPENKLAKKAPPAKIFSFDEVAKFLNDDPAAKSGSVEKGKVHYESRQCARCHKHGAVGQGGLGPDLSAVASRFKRRDLLEAIMLPSKIISDQYRTTRVKTKDGEVHDGLLAINNDLKVELILASGERETIKKSDVQTLGQSDISLMPTGLMDGLTLQEIADLFAFLEASQ